MKRLVGELNLEHCIDSALIVEHGSWDGIKTAALTSPQKLYGKGGDSIRLSQDCGCRLPAYLETAMGASARQ